MNQALSIIIATLVVVLTAKVVKDSLPSLAADELPLEAGKGFLSKVGVFFSLLGWWFIAWIFRMTGKSKTHLGWLFVSMRAALGAIFVPISILVFLDIIGLRAHHSDWAVMAFLTFGCMVLSVVYLVEDIRLLLIERKEDASPYQVPLHRIQATLGFIRTSMFAHTTVATASMAYGLLEVFPPVY